MPINSELIIVISIFNGHSQGNTLSMSRVQYNTIYLTYTRIPYKFNTNDHSYQKQILINLFFNNLKVF